MTEVIGFGDKLVAEDIPDCDEEVTLNYFVLSTCFAYGISN